METTTHPMPRHRLSRPRQGRVLAGVAAAIAGRTGLAVGFVRLAFLVLALFGGFGVLLYAAGWTLLPSSDRAESPAQTWMRRLQTPGSRTGAVLIGIAVLIVLAPFAPFAAIAAAVLLVAGIYLTRSNSSSEE